MVRVTLHSSKIHEMNALIISSTDVQITTRELCMALNVVHTRWVLQILTQEQKNHQIQVSHNLLTTFQD